MDGRSFFTVVGLQVLMLIIWAAPAVSQTGYLSIDCGSDVNYTDSTTGIHWVTDAGYISTGKNAYNLSVGSNDPPVNKKQAETLRYFDEGRSRDCYVLPVTPGRTYLVRPTFYYGNWFNNGSEFNFSSFHVYLNSSFWLSVTLGDYAVQDETLWYETIVYSPGSELYFCLVGGIGGYDYGGEYEFGEPGTTTLTTVISSLELRELSSGMYSRVVRSNTYLQLYTRINCGASLSSPPYRRYPDDPHDRIWSTPNSYNTYNATDISSTSISSGSSTHAPDQPPPQVMEDAWVFHNNTFSYYVPAGEVNVSLYSYFQELEPGNASNVRGMEYYFNGAGMTSFNSSDEPLEIKSVHSVSENVLNVTLAQANWSKLSPILNAIEIYYVWELDTTVTMTEDLNSIAALKTHWNLTDWAGDPCMPVSYDWLVCNLEYKTDSTLRVTALSIQNISVTEVVPREISDLTALAYLNLSYNGIVTFPTNFSLKELNNLTVVDVSHNNFTGNVTNFLAAIDLTRMQEIHAEENQFEGEFPVDLLLEPDVNATVVNFDRNHINGTLNLLAWYTSFLNSAEDGNPPKLQLLSLIDNDITDIYPNLDVLTPDIEALLKSGNRSILDTGILLGGNPCCNQSKSTMSVAQQYLCRLTTDEPIAENPDSKATSSWNGKKLGVTIGTSVGVLVVLICTICFAFLWKLRKQTRAFHEIQEAFAKQKVKPPFYSYAELRAATRDFNSHNKLGHGAFGAVFKGVMTDGTTLAVKKLFPSKQALTEFLNEVVLITGIKHRNLVQLKGCCVNKDQQRLLVYEYAENGNLAEALWDATNKKNKGHGQETKLDWKQRFNICVGVARGLAYLHEELQPRIIHRDIKPAKILIDKNLNPKIADFGLARQFLDEESRADYTNLAGTPGYCAPEYVSQGKLTEKVDVFSFGVLVLEIVSGRPCINRKLPPDEVSLLSWTTNLRIEEKLYDLLEPAVREGSNDKDVIRVINIALLCVHMDPARRPTMSQVVTMLLGSMDVTVFLDSLLYNRPDFYSLLSPGQSSRDSKLVPNLETLNEENDEHSLMDLDFMNLNSTFSSDRGGSLLMTELSATSSAGHHTYHPD